MYFDKTLIRSKRYDSCVSIGFQFTQFHFFSPLFFIKTAQCGHDPLQDEQPQLHIPDLLSLIRLLKAKTTISKTIIPVINVARFITVPPS